jgi:hypothetical protein
MAGHSGNAVRDVLLTALEQRLVTTQASARIECLSNDGSA